MKNEKIPHYILAVETSCDETAAAIIQASPYVKICSNAVSSQIKIHRQYGGVFPELASREHLKNILPVTQKVLADAKLHLNQINLLAVTSGPGLIGSLLIGVKWTKTLSYILDLPIINVHHLEGHIYSALTTLIVNQDFLSWEKSFPLPLLSLIVSGGHTSLILMEEFGRFKIIGETQDDAAGEAFDKVANLLGFPYPGGPAIEKAAKKVSSYSSPWTLPRPMINSSDFNFSFAGLKTAVLYLWRNLSSGQESLSKTKNLIAKEFQQAVIDVLISKTLKAIKKFAVKSVALGGGVAANQNLRQQFKTQINNYYPSLPLLVPPPNLTVDNAAMIGVAGLHKFLKKGPTKWYNIVANANEKLIDWK